MYVCMHVCVCMYVCMYDCMHAYIFSSKILTSKVVFIVEYKLYAGRPFAAEMQKCRCRC